MKTPRDKGTIQELMDFCAELGLTISDGEWLFWKWEGNGWTNGGRPIKSWKATARCWKAGGFFPSQKGSKSSQPKPEGGMVRGW